MLSGLAIGAVYGLIGMALAISFYVTRVINFAQGQMMMAAMMITAAVIGCRLPAMARRLRRARQFLPDRRPVLSRGGEADPGLQPLQFRLARQHARLCGRGRECRGLYLGADVARFPADAHGRSFHFGGRRADRTAAAGDRDRRSCSPRSSNWCARRTLFGKTRHGDRGRSRDGVGDRRQHDRRRDRGLRDLGLFRRRRRRADRAAAPLPTLISATRSAPSGSSP